MGLQKHNKRYIVEKEITKIGGVNFPNLVKIYHITHIAIIAAKTSQNYRKTYQWP